MSFILNSKGIEVWISSSKILSVIFPSDSHSLSMHFTWNNFTWVYEMSISDITHNERKHVMLALIALLFL